jgi:hypothetical protein
MELDAIQRDRSIKNFNIGRDLGKNKCRAEEQKNRRTEGIRIASLQKTTPELGPHAFAKCTPSFPSHATFPPLIRNLLKLCE